MEDHSGRLSFSTASPTAPLVPGPHPAVVVGASTLRKATLCTLRELAHELKVQGKFEQEEAVLEAMGWGEA